MLPHFQYKQIGKEDATGKTEQRFLGKIQDYKEWTGLLLLTLIRSQALKKQDGI